MTTNVFEAGDFVTVVRDCERNDQSFRGEPLHVIHSEGRFIIAIRCRKSAFPTGPISLSLDRYEIVKISLAFVDAIVDKQQDGDE
jgi:hypothetical protein